MHAQKCKEILSFGEIWGDCIFFIYIDEMVNQVKFTNITIKSKI